ncbi:aromatic acid exporter family protein [Geobacillus thermoleovorans]|uniref:FUSC family protein n=1 Tax=Geobacillus TaxID=129337 RepID=UPI00038A2F18|nr:MULTISPECIES: aromatic acid exporter family protein [Geobacillus]EQB95375.1 membrane protein [Geobacillus sp. A8]TRY36218.1 aromatic acid exporter family protein [Geobacillus sp. LEMMJ02]UPT58448.1 aromatic acid exporter family protein [Geobacillus thermoleovorans]
MKLGARIFKTGIAVALALFLAALFQFPSPSFAGISAVFAMQPTIYRSYLSLIEQVQANVIGALFAIAAVFILGRDPLVVGLTLMIVIALCLKMRLESSTISVALVTVIAIMEYTDRQFIQFAAIRFLTMMLGIFAAFVVNLIFLPPKYEKKVYEKISEETEAILKWIRLHKQQAADHHHLKEEIEARHEEMTKLEHLYFMYKEERTYFRRQRFQKSRKLVLYRQMIAAADRALSVLKWLHRLENEFSRLPAELRQAVCLHLGCLLDYHEQLLLKFIHKAKPLPHSRRAEEIHHQRERLTSAFYADGQPPGDYRLFSLIGAIMDYGDRLEHLDKLIDSFHHYHYDDTLEKELEKSAGGRS